MDVGVKVLVAMSGGVDSSVAAYLLKDKGYKCIGVTFCLFSGSGEAARRGEAVQAERSAKALMREERAVADAARAAAALGIEHKVIDLSEEFDERVAAPFVDSYLRGRTPNPCIECNRFIKFASLLRLVHELGADFVASGHYARIAADPSSGRMAVARAVDSTKDQSYVLSRLSQDELSRAVFPLGEMTKEKVREIAEQLHLPNFNRPESQDICFIPDGDYGSFIEGYTGKCLRPGDILSPDGAVIGRHRGIARYTIGQRRGVGISSDKRLFVTAKSADDNTITLGAEEELYSPELTIGDITWGAIPEVTKPIRAGVVTRYHQKETPCTAYNNGGGRLLIAADSAFRAAAPGQTAVLYGSDRVLAAGTILGAGSRQAGPLRE